MSFMIRVAINGFGRIGRNVLRAGWKNKELSFVAINDLSEPAILAHLLQYDSVHGVWDQEVSVDQKKLRIGRRTLPVLAQKDPSLLPWDQLDVDVVIESTGFFTKKADAALHKKAGAKAVLISAPSNDAPTYLMGTNHRDIKPNHNVVCMASCTTNSTAPVIAVMKEAFGVQKAMMTTIHAATAQQNVVDGLPPSHKNDLRRARTVFNNIIPTTTGAAKATGKAIRSVQKTFDGIAVRVPVSDGALSDITILTRKNVTVEDVNKAFKKAARLARWKNVLAVSDKPIVSSDIIGNPHAAIVDLPMTRVVDGNLVKILAWYDNEWGYSNQLVRMATEVGKRLKK